MLPGFRFLFAAIMLSMSLLIFGLGAAALLRAAHESFASNSSWRGTPDVPFAQRPESTLPMLATLRVEPMTEKTNDAAKVAIAEPAPLPAEPVVSVQVAALRPLEAPAAEAVKSESAPIDVPRAQNAPAPEAAPVATAPAETTASIAETKTMAMPDMSSGNSTPVVSQPEPTVPTVAAITAPVAASPTASETDSAITKIATLGGPPVEVIDDTPDLEIRAVKIPRARPDQDAINKRGHARRAAHRRRLALRAQLVAQQLQLQQANPFAQLPLPVTTTRQTHQQPAVTP